MSAAGFDTWPNPLERFVVTPRWRKQDPNRRSPSRGCRLILGEEKGPAVDQIVSKDAVLFTGDQWFESVFLHRRVCEPSVPQRRTPWLPECRGYWRARRRIRPPDPAEPVDDLLWRTDEMDVVADHPRRAAVAAPRRGSPWIEACTKDTSLTASGRAAATPSHGVLLAEAFRVWLRVAALSFGGPAGQIAVMHRIIVDEKKWVGEKRFLGESARSFGSYLFENEHPARASHDTARPLAPVAVAP
jgi:Chromate transporter